MIAKVFPSIALNIHFDKTLWQDKKFLKNDPKIHIGMAIGFL